MNINYEHLHLIDNFYAPESGRGEKLRVTRDEKTGEVRACMRKIRLGNLDIFCPKRSVDWRISVNMEIPGAFGDLASPGTIPLHFIVSRSCSPRLFISKLHHTMLTTYGSLLPALQFPRH